MVNTMEPLNRPLPTQLSRPYIESLPNELLATIFSHLNSPPPSASHLLDEPRYNVTESEDASIKSASWVSRRWRQVIIPLLFKNARFAVEPTTTPRSVVKEQIQPFYDFITANKLQKVVKTFTLLVHDTQIAYSSKDGHETRSILNFWADLFNVIDPLELLVVAPSEALGKLTSCNVNLEDAWAFDCPCQYLRLQRLKSAPGMDLTLSPIVTLPNLWEIRPWSGLLLNEGSFIRAYATYEFWQRQPPSILQDVLGDNKTAKKPLISPTIRDFSYIGLFPMANHFNSIAEDCPRVDRLYIQLVPRNEILQQSSKMAQVEAEDLWMERNSCYALLMRELFTTPPLGNFKYLKIFESGDAADEEAWLLAVEFVKRNSNGWHIASQGVFVKEAKEKKSGLAESEAEQSALSVSKP